MNVNKYEMKTETEKQASKDIWSCVKTGARFYNTSSDHWYITPKYLFTEESKYLNKLLNV